MFYKEDASAIQIRNCLEVVRFSKLLPTGLLQHMGQAGYAERKPHDVELLGKVHCIALKEKLGTRY
jgi:hypothetical protein